MGAFNRLHELRMENDSVRYSMDDMRPRFERMRGRHENGSAPRAVSVHQLFQTPLEIAGRVVELADVRPGMRVLEPSAGLGRLVVPAMSCNPDSLVAIDVNTECVRALFEMDLDRVTILQRDFLGVSVGDIGLFDRVVMNPPFTMKSDIAHIQHARRFLKSDGRLVAICMDGHRREEELGPLCDHWEKLPSGSFKREGTNVPTVLLSTSSH